MADFQLSGNTVLSESSGNVSWSTGAPVGTVLQVQYAELVYPVGTLNTTDTDTGLQ